MTASGTTQEHWNQVYRAKALDSVSWYQLVPETSLHVLDELAVPTTASLVDVGGGASSLVDHLLMRGWLDVTVVDISSAALEVAKVRLGPAARQAGWLVADVTTWRPGRLFDVWHDRAVLHFLTQPEQRSAYVRALHAGTAKGSLVIIATFALDGPHRCSGLPVQRYDADLLAREIGVAFALERHWREAHSTPDGNPQAFQWCVFRRR